MHEFSICQSILSQVKSIAHEHAADSVQRIILHIGPLSGVEPQLLMQAFPLASAGTIAEEATLVIESLPIRVRCQACEQESEAVANNLSCRHCGHYQTRLLSGDELLLAKLELSTSEQQAVH
jgi:hydrogenase nickel incorporation protein HypA/HybF